MNPQKETHIALIAAGVFLLLLILSLMSCKTKTVTQTEVVTVHDTLITHHTDTVREVKVTVKTDTVRQVESHTYTIDNVGDTIKEIHHLVEREKVIVVDSTDRYKAVVDSLRKALSEEKSKEKTVVKRYPIPWWLIAVFVAVMLALCIKALKKMKFIDRI